MYNNSNTTIIRDDCYEILRELPDDFVDLICTDPYLGSGTTALACQLLNRQCIGIEVDEEYYKIAIARCSIDKV